MRFLLLPTWQKIFLLRCLLLIAAMRIGLHVLKFDRLRRLTTSPKAIAAALEAGPPPADMVYLKQVAWGVTRAAAYVPRASCLTQALAAQYLLSRHGIASSIRLGVERDSVRRLNAHAWLICGGYIVTGGESGAIRNFSQIADFGPVP